MSLGQKWETVFKTSEKPLAHKGTTGLVREQNDLVEILWMMRQGWNHEEGRQKHETMYTVECLT